MKDKTFIDKKITIRQFLKSDLKNVKKFRDFINSFVEEDAQIMMNEKISLKGEVEWLKGKLESIKKGKAVFLVAEHNGRIIGTTGINLRIWRENRIGNLNIIIKKGYRGIGLGTYLMKEIIKLSEEN